MSAIDSALLGRLAALASSLMLRGAKVESEGPPGPLDRLWPGARPLP